MKGFFLPLHKRLILTVVLCLAGAVGLAETQRRSRHKTYQIDPDLAAYIRANVKPDPPEALSPDQAARNRQRPFYEVDDPTIGPNRKFRNPPGAAAVRTVLKAVQPVPPDRIAYFAPLDHDPLSEQFPRSGWWLSVKRVEQRADGWVADVMARVKFDPQQAQDGIPRVTGFWMERYQFAGGKLSYLGGHFEPPDPYFRVPTIEVIGRISTAAMQQSRHPRFSTTGSPGFASGHPPSGAAA